MADRPRSLIPCLVALFGLLHPAAADEASTAEDVAFFESKVRPILVEHCDGCHSADAETVRGGLLLDTRAGWAEGGDSGPAIEPGDPEASPLIWAVRYDDPLLKMPPQGKLPDAAIADLEAWIRRGAPDPRAGKSAAPPKPAGRTIDLDAARKEWPYTPIVRPEPPSPSDPVGWCRNPIDRFILDRLGREGLAPSPEADRRVLIRRAALDLTGLPPTPEEVDAFVADPDPDAYANLIDRLLERPSYGERWARHWLDVARYAESHGFEHDYDRPSAYVYRDFVIKALNEDMPYDRFVRWQLAGDELAPEDPLAVTATGFLAAGVHSTQITANQVEKERYDELDDMLGTTGTAFLGLTIGCARCHDHKFDPIPQADYYRLLSTFTTTVRSEIDLDLDPERCVEAKAAEREPAANAPEPEVIKALISTEGLPAVRLHTQGADFLEATHFLKRGDPNQKEGVATQSFLHVLMNESEDAWRLDPPDGWRTSYRRASLANWMTDTEGGAGQLLARVIVNRLWQHHHGRGIVATPSDFGNQGPDPTHPELLDWLASELIRDGWRLKPIHRLMMTSATYRQASAFDESKSAIDPENLLHWRRDPQRLEAEAIRDAMLSVSGRLDPTMFGPGTLDEAMTRRSIYFTVKRSQLIPMMTLFDAPDALTPIAVRSSTTVAPQSLYLLNSPIVRDWAAAFADRVAPADGEPIEAAIARAYRHAFGRSPTELELADARGFVESQASTYEGDVSDPGRSALTDLCQALLASNEFLYVE